MMEWLKAELYLLFQSWKNCRRRSEDISSRIPYFEIYEGQPCIAFCNEEAKLHGFPYNHPANRAWRIAFKAATGKTPEPDYLVGPIAIVTGDEEFLEAL